LPNCSECGTEVDAPIKTWSISRRSSKTTGTTEIVLGMYECSECGNKFRAGVRNMEEISIKGVAERIKNIEGEFLNTLKNLREKLKTLETERSNLLVEIDGLKKMAEAKADALESEIGMLRDEVQSLKQLLGVGEMDS
jgi:DNA-directed RNA polymerase subunit RPC12/RpoP